MVTLAWIVGIAALLCYAFMAVQSIRKCPKCGAEMRVHTWKCD